MKRICAVDFGKKRIGIAISDERQKIAFPLSVLLATRDPVGAVIAFLKKRGDPIEKILVGYPLLLNGQKGEMALWAEKLAADLFSRFGAPVELIDERLSSRQVERFSKGGDDSSVAALLLQTHLDKTMIG